MSGYEDADEEGKGAEATRRVRSLGIMGRTYAKRTEKKTEGTEIGEGMPESKEEERV
jgi:hypothetical protein